MGDSVAPKPKKRQLTKLQRLAMRANGGDPVTLAYEGKLKHSIFGRFPRHTRLLGVIAGLWGTLELVMGDLFVEIMEPRGIEARAVYYALANHRARRDILRMAGAERFRDHPALQDRLSNIINQLGKRADRRNNLIHSGWVYSLQDEAITRYAPLLQTGIKESEADLQRFIEALKETIDKIATLRFDVRDLNGEEMKALERAIALLPLHSPPPGSRKGRRTPRSKSRPLA